MHVYKPLKRRWTHKDPVPNVIQMINGKIFKGKTMKKWHHERMLKQS